MTILENIERDFGVFESIAESADRRTLSRYVEAIHQKFCNIFSTNSYLHGVHWIVRHYMASKKLALSALFYTQAKYLMKMRMKNLSFYACYYSLFNGLSAALLMNPNMSLDQSNKISHGKVAKEIENLFVKTGIFPSDLILLLGDLRFARELYSYHLPLTGLGQVSDKPMDAEAYFNRLSSLLPLVMQVTNLISHVSHMAWTKKVTADIDEYFSNVTVVDDFFHSVVRHDDVTGKRCHYDEGDYYQLAYYLVKIGKPSPISWFIDDKMFDALEGAWGEDESPDEYSIDSVSEYVSDSLGPNCHSDKA